MFLGIKTRPVTRIVPSLSAEQSESDSNSCFESEGRNGVSFYAPLESALLIAYVTRSSCYSSKIICYRDGYSVSVSASMSASSRFNRAMR
jgi:hypothetical protein